MIEAEKGELLYRGYPIEELVEHSTYEEVAYLILKGELPDRSELEAFSAALAEERALPKELITVFRTLPRYVHTMDAVREAVGVLAAMDPDMLSNTSHCNMKKAVRLLAKLPTAVAYQWHIAHGDEPIPPDPALTHSANFLHMIRGERPADYETRAFDRSLILYAEHGFSASSFAARVTASTLSDMHSAVIAAIAALKGPLHGGANEKAMDNLIDIREPQLAEQWVKEMLGRKKRIAGFGHRVYRGVEPRGAIVREIAREISEKTGETRWFEVSRVVEKTMMETRGLYPNLDFYSATVYYLLGIPIPLYTPVFAAARMAGLGAHVIEQHENNRLIRPRSEYTGPSRREYVPIDAR